MVSAQRILARRLLASMLLAGFGFFVALQVFGVVEKAFAIEGTSNLLGYQGRLLNANGVPVADASATMIFELYTAASGGSCVWSNSSTTCASATGRTVTLNDGLFSEALGDTAAGTPYAAISESVFADNAALYLQVTINGEALSPRKQILASGYALNAQTVDGYGPTTSGATTSKLAVFDTNGNLQITGSPQSSAVGAGSLYINPGAGVVAANEALFNVAVGGSHRFAVDAEGDVGINGDVSVGGGDLTSTTTSFNLLNTTVTTLTMAGAATLLDINNAALTSTINIGGTSADGANLINIATNSTSADTINIGNTNASTALSLTGGTAWSIASNGTISTLSNIAVNGGIVQSTQAITIASTGGNINLSPNGTGLAYVTAGDDFAVGGNSLSAPFSVDESTNAIRIGDAVNDANDPSIFFYASDASDVGTLSYADEDRFSFSGGDIIHVGLGAIPTVASTTTKGLDTSSSFTGTSNANLNTLNLYSLAGVNNYSAVENVTSTDHVAAGTFGNLAISGASTTITQGYGVRGYVANTSTNASLLQSGGVIAGVGGQFEQNAAQTVSAAAGSYGSILATSGTITEAIGAMGQVLTSAGTITSGYGGRFMNTSAGTTRYGLYAEASGGTTSYAGYFAGRVQIEDDGTAATPNVATGAGDLYVLSDIEVDGSISIGDTTGSDSLSFTSGTTGVSSGVKFTMDSLASGTGFLVSRGTGGADFDGQLAYFQQSNSSATSDADTVVIENAAGGDGTGLYIVQAQVTDETNGAGGTTIGAQALTIEIQEAASNDDAVLIRTAGNLVFAIESDGSVLSDQAYSAAGADYAEYFLTADSSLANSEVVCQDTVRENAVKRCEAGNTAVVGVISPDPGFIGNLPDAAAIPASYVIVGLTGQIDTFVSAAEDAIDIGDPITTSQTVAGYGAKAHGPGQIIGFALESLASGTGTIKVYINPQWYGGDVLTTDGVATVSNADFALSPSGTATSSASFASQDLELRGSSWNGSTAVTESMALRTSVDGNTRLSVVNDAGGEVAYIGEGGDLAIAGRLYPSDRGALQTSKYIYYDGSTGPGGDMMRTNAAGWSSGSYDFAEMFPSREMLAAGEVVVFADGDEEVRRSTGTTYDQKIAGVVSTSPAFLAGENRAGDVPVALAGRVPTYVSGENGAIAIGDPLTTSGKPGYAMKATEAGPIVGYAMESFSGTTGVVTVFIRPSYYDGGPVEEAPIAENSASSVGRLASLDVSGSLNMNGGSILSVASLMGIGGNWRIGETGDIFTRGRIVQLVRSYAGEDVETYASASREQTITLSGTAILRNGRASVVFEDIDPAFNDIIANTVPYRVYLTPAGMTGMLAAVDRSNAGFRIMESGATDGVAVDWFVVAYHKDYAPEPVVPDTTTPPSELATEEPIVEETPTESTVAEIDTPVAEEEVVAPVEETPVVTEEVAEPSEEPVQEVEPVAESVVPIAEEPIEESTPEEVSSVEEVPPQEQL